MSSQMNSEEKEKLIADLKETVKDFSRLGRSIVKPFLNFVEKKYDSLSPEKKQKVQNIIDTLKTKKENWINVIKEFISKKPKK